MEDCLLASERGNLARKLALKWCRAEGLSAWERSRSERGQGARDERVGPDRHGRARLRNLVVREGRHTGRLQVRIVTTMGELRGWSARGGTQRRARRTPSQVSSGRARAASPRPHAGGETELVWGEAELPERLGELDLRISSEAFFQTNTEMAELLYGIVADYAALEGWERVYDLYSGIGTIALTLAAKAGEMWGIELVEQAVADAIKGASAMPSRTCTSSPATPAWRYPSCSSERDARCDRGRPAPSQGLRRKWSGASSRPRPSASSTSPAIPPRSLPMRPNWWGPAGCCARSALWTCSADPPHRVRGAAHVAAMSRGRWGRRPPPRDRLPLDARSHHPRRGRS